MKRSGIANMPLHGGKAPAWLFSRMKLLSREILYILRIEYEPCEILRRFSDPFWFQAFGCALGFDWHSSGVTTTVCGAVKEALKEIGKEIGVFAAGGKGKTALNTPVELARIGDAVGVDADRLIYASRMSAKVDNVALQDGYRLYHHSIFFTKDASWCVVQQGMNDKNGYARRYHWISENLISFVETPHSAICCNEREENVLDLTAKESSKTRKSCVETAKENPDRVVVWLKEAFELTLPKRHYITEEDVNTNRLRRNLIAIHEANPENFEELLRVRGAGEKTLRALSLISELIYSSKPSFKDPARFSFAHGGKDGHPYPVDRKLYDSSIETLKEAVNRAKIGEYEKLRALRRLSKLL